MTRELSEAATDSIAISPAEIKSEIKWVVRQVAQTIEHISEVDARVLLMFAVDVKGLTSRWPETWRKPTREMLEKEGWPALEHAVLAILAQRGDGSSEPIREWSESDAQILFADAFSRLVAVVGGVAVSVEYYQRLKRHELGHDAAVLLAAMKGTRLMGVEESYRRLFNVTAATFYERGKGFWEPEFERESGESVARVTLDAARMDLNSQIPITLHDRFAANGDAAERTRLRLKASWTSRLGLLLTTYWTSESIGGLCERRRRWRAARKSSV